METGVYCFSRFLNNAFHLLCTYILTEMPTKLPATSALSTLMVHIYVEQFANILLTIIKESRACFSDLFFSFSGMRFRFIMEQFI